MDEILLAEEVEGRGLCVLEGTQTNFFVVAGGAVHTANEGILEGTVRTLVLEVCRKEGIPVVLHAPALAEVESWDGAFLSSTSRLVLPIDSVELPPPIGSSRVWERVDPLVQRIESLVARDVAAHSEDVLESA